MMSKGERLPHAVIAAAKDDARFKAVEVRKQDNVIEVLWTQEPARRQPDVDVPLRRRAASTAGRGRA